MKCGWEAPSPAEQEHIIALNTMVTSLRAKTKASKAKSPNSSPRAGESKGLSHKNDGRYAWKEVALKAGEPTSRTQGGKKYFCFTDQPREATVDSKKWSRINCEWAYIHHSIHSYS
jgi:hypothetical protein